MKRTDKNRNDYSAIESEAERSTTHDIQNKRKIGKLGFVLGQITGTNVIAHSLENVSSAAVSSTSRIGTLAKSVFNNKQDLPTVASRGSESERFSAAMKLHRIDETRLTQMIRNTKTNFNLYFGLLVLGIVIGFLSVIFYPPSSVASVLIRFLSVPFLSALSFKHAYSNWLFRSRKLSSPLTYFRSGDIWPKSSTP